MTKEATLRGEAVRREIRAGIESAGEHFQPKGSRGYFSRVAEHLGMKSQQLSHRLAGDTELELEAIIQIALFIKAPLGWPFIPYQPPQAQAK